MYSVDTNIFLDWWVRRYPDDVFPSIRTKIESLIAAGKWMAVERVAAEIQYVGPLALKAWAKTFKGQFRAHDSTLLAPYSACRFQQIEGYAPGGKDTPAASTALSMPRGHDCLSGTDH